MNYELFEKFLIHQLKLSGIWDDNYKFVKNKNVHGQSKSIFIELNNKRLYIAKYFNYIEDVDIKLSYNEWKNIESLEDYLNYLDENYDVNIDEVSEALELKKRCFTRYVIASNDTIDVFPKIIFSIEEISMDCSIGGILIEEAINGITLEEYEKLSKKSKTDRIDESIDFLLEISKKMLEYTSKGFVHRDLSPDNIMMVMEDNKICYKIIDPGVVKILSRNSTKGNVAFCKIKYSSPEQFIGNGTNVNFTSDIYVIGIVVYEYITGVNLINKFSGPGKYPHKIIDELLDRFVEDIYYRDITNESEKIDKFYLIIKKMLKFNREDRFDSIESFVSAIETIYSEGDEKND